MSQLVLAQHFTTPLRGAVTLGDLTRQHVVDYMDEAVMRPSGGLREPSRKMRQARLYAVRWMFGYLMGIGAVTEDPTRGIVAKDASGAAARPLSDAEIDVVRAVAARSITDTVGPACVALAESGGRPGEIARVMCAQVSAVDVTLGKNSTQRTNPLTDWGRSAVAAHRLVACREGADRFVSAALDPYAGSASVSRILKQVLAQAGLTSDPRVLPTSIRVWAARRLYLRDRDLLAVRNFLGLGSFDSAARAIGIGMEE